MPFIKIDRKQEFNNNVARSQQNISKFYVINDLQKTLDQR